MSRRPALTTQEDVARAIGPAPLAQEGVLGMVTSHPAARQRRGLPAYVSKASLAHELDMAESTVDEMVKRGVLPKPVKLSSGCVRWSWVAVERALASLAGTIDDGGDPYMKGAKNASKATP
jgi:predicted DNA-binding transcriptional regulator AlpA